VGGGYTGRKMISKKKFFPLPLEKGFLGENEIPLFLPPKSQYGGTFPAFLGGPPPLVNPKTPFQKTIKINVRFPLAPSK